MTPKQLLNQNSISKIKKRLAKYRVTNRIFDLTEINRESGADEVKWEKSYRNDWWQRLFLTILLTGQVFLRILQGKICRRHLVEQMAIVGFSSLNSVLLIAFFAGIIFTIQTAREMLRFGAIHLVGGAFALAFCRELAPILTAAIVAGQVGSAFTAEIGEMQVTEQIDALYMLRSNPIDYLVVPRVVACCIMLPVLTIFALVIGIFGGALVATNFYGLPTGIFLNSVRDFLELTDLFAVVIKAFIFGGIVAVISCGWGLTTKGGSKGVSRSTTGAVVTSWVAIFMTDFILSLAIFQEMNIK